jgi:hypothetical protein
MIADPRLRLDRYGRLVPSFWALPDRLEDTLLKAQSLLLATASVATLVCSVAHATSAGCPNHYDVGDAVINVLTAGQKDRQCDQQRAQHDADMALQRLQFAHEQMTQELTNDLQRLHDADYQLKLNTAQLEIIGEVDDAFYAMKPILKGLNNQFDAFQHYLQSLSSTVGAQNQLIESLNQDMHLVFDQSSGEQSKDPYTNQIRVIWKSASARYQSYGMTIGQYLGCVIAQGAIQTGNPAQTFQNTLQTLTLQISMTSKAISDLEDMKTQQIKDLIDQVNMISSQIQTLTGVNMGIPQRQQMGPKPQTPVGTDTGCTDNPLTHHICSRP